MYARIADWLIPLIELVLVLASIVLIFTGQRKAHEAAGFARIENFFSRLARRKTLAILTCGGLVFAARVALVPLLGIPEPTWHDEFSFLLAGDTFAHGRLTNPTHPMWQHFESFHIIEQPTYMSMYPPSQGVALAIGQLLGHPWIGQLLATAVMCSALCWMLQGWLPASWALFGGLLVGFRIGILSYWMNSYFCGSLPALGGALVLGALPRLLRGARLRDSLWMATGLVILANSRPYEGFVFSLPIAGALGCWFFKQERFSCAQLVRTVVLPISLTLMVAGGAMGYYFWRVTGNPLRMPYEVNRETYASAPYFVWGKPRPVPVYRHEVMRAFYQGWEYEDWRAGQSLWGFLARCRHKAFVLWTFYLGPLLSVPLFAFPWLFRDRRMRFPLLLAGSFVVGLLLEIWTGSHYAAPATGLLYLLLLQSMRHLRLWRWHGSSVGLALVRAVPLVALAMILLRLTAVVAHARIEPSWTRGNLERAGLQRSLEHTPGDHVIIVRYAPTHGSHIEWVYNRADIDHAKVVWARDMGQEKNAELVQYFSGRKFWILNADERPIQLQPYSP